MKRFLTLALLLITPALSGPAFAQTDLAFPGTEPVVADQLYLTTETISVTLPAATGGSGSGYTYTLEDADGGVPGGLAFDAAARVLSGTPDTVNTGVAHTYTVTDTSTPPMTATVTFDIAVARVRLVIGGDLEGRITTSDVNLLNAGSTGTRRLTGTLTLNATGTFARLGSFGTYGFFTINAGSGAWAYTAGLFGGQLRRIRALLPGQMAFERFRVRATDEDGFTINGEVTIILTGANNRPDVRITKPVFPDTLVGSGAIVVVDGEVTDPDDQSADVPVAPTVLWSTDPPMTGFGDPTALTTTFVAVPPDEETQIQLILTVTDAGGLSNSARITLVLDPFNEPATFGGVITGAVTEDDNPVSSGALMVLQAGGTLTVDNPDGENMVVAQTAAACTNGGVFDITTAGVWTYEVDNALDAVQGLGVGEDLVDICTVTADDDGRNAATVNVAITITGVNDAPTVTVDISSPTGIAFSLALGDELNPGTVLTLTATVVDADVNDALTYAWLAVSGPSNAGSFSDATAAVTTWTAPNFVATPTLSLTVSDEASNVVWTRGVTVFADSLVFTAPIPDQFYLQGIAISDLTLPETTGTGVGGSTTPSTYALDPVPAGLTFDDATRILSGTPTDAPTGTTHTYTATNGTTSISITFLINEEELIPAFAVTSLPDRRYTVNVPIAPLTLPAATGGNAELTYAIAGIRPCDCLPLLVLPAGLAFDDDTRVLSGTPTVTQPETTYRYFVVDNDIDGELDIVRLDFLITVGGLELEIIGDLTGAVTEDAAQNTAIGTVAISSTDPATATTFVAQTGVESTLGSYDITENGVWTYTLDNTNDLTQALSMGVMAGDVLTIMGTAGITRDINIVVTGANDQPTAAISAPTAGTTVGFGGEVTVTGSGSDPDSSDILTYTWSTEPPGRGSFAAAAATTTWTAPNSGTEAVTLVLTVTDSATPPGSATAQVSGFMPQAEAATIDAGGNRAGSVVEDDPDMNTATGTLAVTNADGGSTDVVVQTPGTGTGTYGSLSFIGSVWTYTLDNDDPDTNALTAGDSVMDTFTVAAAANPGSTAMITITITGVNDAPTVDITAPSAGNISRESTVTLRATVTDPDTDAGTLMYAWTTTPANQGSFADAGSPDTTWDPPTITMETVITLTLTVNDGTVDGVDTLALTITLDPVVNDVTVTTTTSGASDATGTLTILSLPAGATPDWRAADTDGTYGTFSIIAATGVWTYTLDNTRDATRNLGPTSPAVVETFTATTTVAGFSLTATITINLNPGAFPDDPPVATAMINGVAGASATVDEGEMVTLTAAGTDPDNENNAITYQWAHVPPQIVTFDPAGGAAQTVTFMAPEERTTLGFTLTPTSPGGSAVVAPLRVTIEVGGTASERALQKTLAAFGRAFATGTVGVFEDYLSAPATSANTSHFTIGGHKFDMATTTPSAAVGTGRDLSALATPPSFPNDRKTGSDSDRLFHRIGNPVEHDLADTINSANLADTTSNGANADTPTDTTTTLMSGHDLLMKSAFHFNLNDAATSTSGWSIWARATTTNFNGKPEDDFELDGDVTSAYLGTDYQTPTGTRLGIAISQSDGEVDYDDATAEAQGDLDADLTSVLPYIQWTPSDTTNAWAMLGYGTGDAELATDGDDETTEVDIDMQMIALGISGDLTTGQRSEWSWKASAFP